ncbi:DinB family protein [Paenibacillus macquariensis]|uniref:DinB superfamily protein n=1 Tax=Paenibacillus macquariensis TaxID=948756 RepID=A0ABY1JUL2_9BACL|nr:DinB family protein [Paenibacillus macquariensis]MEC0090914.1 DinB family protein [Paenibacillus macquariensis]OAB34643.1 hypothetical protein PMSM_12385 [Paenibacillus macquariensis subsp. macquariensis]SIQ80782.1 DinB superfamily protein [Paenibacillus macquariensis]
MEQYIVSFITDAEAFSQLVRGIPVEELNYKPTVTSWSITEIIVHVVDTEMILQHRIKAILAEDNPIIQAFDQNLWASELQYSSRDIEDQLALFVLLRKVFAPTLKIIRDVDGERVGTHSTDGSIQLKDIVKKMSTHLQGHIEQIERNRAAFVLLK